MSLLPKRHLTGIKIHHIFQIDPYSPMLTQNLPINDKFTKLEMGILTLEIDKCSYQDT